MGRRYHEEESCEIILNLYLWFIKGMYFLELWQPFCSAEHNHLCNIGRGYPEKQLCEIICNLGQWFRRRHCLKYYLPGALAALLFVEALPFMQF